MPSIVLANRARMNVSTSGLSTFTLSSAATGHQTFAAAGVSDGDVVYYTAETSSRTQWEVGRGTYNNAGPTLTRDEIFDSSNSGAKVNFTNAPEAWVDAPDLAFLQPFRVVSAAGDVTIVANTDGVVVVKKTVGAATGVTLPASADAVRPITIKDGKGDANTNNITITPNGSETIDGDASIVLDFDYQAATLYPYPDGTGWFLA